MITGELPQHSLVVREEGLMVGHSYSEGTVLHSGDSRALEPAWSQQGEAGCQVLLVLMFLKVCMYMSPCTAHRHRYL